MIQRPLQGVRRVAHAAERDAEPARRSPGPAGHQPRKGHRVSELRLGVLRAVRPPRLWPLRWAVTGARGVTRGLRPAGRPEVGRRS